MSPQVGWLCVFSGEEKTFSECIACSKTDAHCEFTPEMLILMSRGQRGKKNPLRPSVTAILSSCLRQVVIKDRFDYRVSPRRSWFLFRGNLIHNILEGVMTRDGWKEAYLSRDIKLLDGRTVVIGGVVDKVIIEKGLIRDYKTAKRLPTKATGSYSSHSLQLNIYRWIWWPIFRATKLRLQYIDMGGTKQVKVDILPIEEVEELIRERATAYVHALEEDQLPVGECNLKDWVCRYCDVQDICKKLNKEEQDASTKEGKT